MRIECPARRFAHCDPHPGTFCRTLMEIYLDAMRVGNIEFRRRVIDRELERVARARGESAVITCHLKYCHGESVGVCSCGNTVCCRHDGRAPAGIIMGVLVLAAQCVSCRWKESK